MYMMHIRWKSKHWDISRRLLLCGWVSLRALGQCAGIATAPTAAADCAAHAAAQDRVRVRFLSYDEEANFRKAIAEDLPGRIKDDSESAFSQLDLALHTGMRRSERFTATWDQVDLERGYI
jgi:integrase